MPVLAPTPADIASAHAVEIVAAACAYLHATPSDLRLEVGQSFEHPELPHTYGFLVIARDKFLGLRATLEEGKLSDWKVMEMD